MDPAAILSLADHVIPLSAAIHWPETVGCGLPDAPYRLRVQTEATVHPCRDAPCAPAGKRVGICRKFEKTEDFTVRPYSVSM